MQTKTFDFSTATVREIYSLLISAVVPRPIAWVSSLNQSAEGSVNLAPFSFFNAVSSSPPCLVFSIARKRDGTKKDTLINIERLGEFVVHVASEDLAEAVNETSAELEYGISEVTRAGLSLVNSRCIQTPRILEAPIAMECKIEKLVEIGEPAAGAATLVIGKILLLHAADGILTNGQIDISKLKPLSRLGGLLYGKTRETFELARPK